MGNILKTIGIAAGALALSLTMGCQNNQSGQTDSESGAVSGRIEGGGWIYSDDSARSVPPPDAGREPRAEPRPAPRPVAFRGSCAPNVPQGFNSSGLAFPTGDAATSAIMLHQIMPATVRANSEFEFMYHVCNLTSGTLQNVVVSADSIENMTIVSSDPALNRSGSGAVFPLGDLGPNESRMITVVARAGSTGMGSGCISVSYNNVLCQTVQFVEPALQLAKTISPQPSVLRCDPITITYRVTNPGTGIAQNVRVRDNLPSCMRLTSGGNTVDQAVGDLGPGESRDITVSIEAVSTGTCSSRAVATADGNLTAESGQPEITIVEPVLAVDVECPGRRFVNRTATFTYMVENNGNGPANNAVLRATVPSGAEFVSATQGGVLQGNQVVWNLGTLSAGASATGEIQVRARSIGTLTSTATLSGDCAADATDSCSTDVEGIPAILLEVIDTDDPVEIGATTTYVITVTNQGSAQDTNIRVVATLSDQTEFVSASGATNGSARGQVVTFQPLPTLAPGAQSVFRLVVRAVEEGDSRLALEMTSDQFQRPIEETESTNLYR